MQRIDVTEDHARAGLDVLDRLPLDATTFPDLVNAVREVVAGVVGPVGVGIMLWDEESGAVHLVPGSFDIEETSISASYRRFEGARRATQVFVTGEPYLNNDPYSDEAIVRGYLELFGVEHLLIVPLDSGARRIGVLQLSNRQGGFEPADITALAPLTPRIANALEIATMLFGLRRRQRLEAILGDVAIAIASARSVREFLFASLDELCAVADTAVATLVVPDSPPLVWRAANLDDDAFSELLSQVHSEPVPREEVQPPAGPPDLGWAGFYVPVRLGTQLVGTLATFRTRSEPFSAYERDAFVRLGNLTALAWAAERYQHQRAELARIDERERIADDLHDDVAQILFGAEMSLDSILHGTAPLDPAVREHVARARALVMKSDEAVRNVIGQLARPKVADLCTDLGLVVADTEAEFGLPIRLEISEAASIATVGLRRSVRNIFARVARESLVNAAKHAGPCRAIVRLQVNRGRRLVLTVVDDGIGIQPNAPVGHGLVALRRALRAHGGTLRVSTDSASGVKVLAGIDL